MPGPPLSSSRSSLVRISSRDDLSVVPIHSNPRRATTHLSMAGDLVLTHSITNHLDSSSPVARRSRSLSMDRLEVVDSPSEPVGVAREQRQSGGIIDPAVVAAAMPVGELLAEKTTPASIEPPPSVPASKDNSKILKTGLLFKRSSGILKSWNQRYFVLAEFHHSPERVLQWFRIVEAKGQKMRESMPLGQVWLRETTVVDISGDKLGRNFVFCVNGPKDAQLFLSALDAKSKATWLRLLAPNGALQPSSSSTSS
jgi:hypothetical protein